MKLVLAVLVGLLLTAHVVADDDDEDYHKECGDTIFHCVESHEHCWKQEVCEDPETVACGKEWCFYPEICRYDTKKVCKNVTKYKKVCEDPKYNCEQEVTACGDDFCTYDEECVETEVCKVVKIPSAGYSGSASASSSAVAQSSGGPAKASAKAVSTASSGPTYKDEKVCHKEHQCAFKDPCETVYAQKCVHAELKEGKSYKGKTFDWMDSWEVGQMCGNGFCTKGYKCANVASKICPEGVKCGNKICDPGHKCLEEEEVCKDVPYTTLVCADEKIGVCQKPHGSLGSASANAKAVAVSSGGSAHASAKAVATTGSGYGGPEPACKVVWKCEDAPCGDSYCEAGTACHVQVIPCKAHKVHYGED